MKKRELIRYICSGGLRMFDSECSIRWHNMPDDERADWLVFFDMCRDEPAHHTEAVISAIAAGLCPKKAVVRRSGLGPWYGHAAESPPEKVWYFRSGKSFDGRAGTVPETTGAFTHYLIRASAPWQAGGALYCVSVEEAQSRLSSYFHRYGTRAHVFKHPAHAWAFLLSFL